MIKHNESNLNLISERSVYKSSSREVKIEDRSDSQESVNRTKKFVQIRNSAHVSLPVSKRE